MSKSIAYKHYLRALSQWPKDALRPECQFQDIIRRRIDLNFNPTGTSTTGAAALPLNGKADMGQVNALYSLLENRYTNQFPLSSAFMRPTSNPNHYTNLVKELEDAPKRSMLGNMINKWKGFLRYE